MQSLEKEDLAPDTQEMHLSSRSDAAKQRWVRMSSAERERALKRLRSAPDVNTWANAGPGAVRGINRVLGRAVDASLKPEAALAQMRQLQHKLSREWPSGEQWLALELRDIESSLCEFDKYERKRTGEGAPKQLFKPSKEPLHD